MMSSLKKHQLNITLLIHSISPMIATFQYICTWTQQNFNSTQYYFLGLSIFKNGEFRDSPPQIPTENPELVINKARSRIRQRSVFETRCDDEAIEDQDVQNYSCL